MGYRERCGSVYRGTSRTNIAISICYVKDQGRSSACRCDVRRFENYDEIDFYTMLRAVIK